jgi:hypothetical protein
MDRHFGNHSGKKEFDMVRSKAEIKMRMAQFHELLEISLHINLATDVILNKASDLGTMKSTAFFSIRELFFEFPANVRKVFQRAISIL